jgi:hypothetical protein
MFLQVFLERRQGGDFTFTDKEPATHMKKLIYLLILFCLTLLQCECGTSIRDFDYATVSLKNRKWARVTSGAWKIDFPTEWKMIKMDKTGKGSFIQLRRKMSGYNGTIDCLIKHIPTDRDVSSYSKNNFTAITAHLIRSGFDVNRFRETIITDLDRATPIPLAGFSYEFSGKKRVRKHLAISVFLKGEDTVLNINFETTPYIYNRYRKELKEIIGTISHSNKIVNK